MDMERDGEDEEDEEVEDEKKEEEVDEDEEDDEDNGKEPRMIGQGEMVNTSPDDADIMVDDQPTVLPEEGHEMREYTRRPQPLAPVPWPQISQPRPLTVHCGESHRQWAGVFVGCDAANKLPSGTNSARS